MRCIYRFFFLFICLLHGFKIDAQGSLSPQQFYNKFYSQLDFRIVEDYQKPQSELTRKNCFYVINRQYNLHGEKITLPKGAVVYFVNEGGFNHGIIELSDNCHLIGGNFNFSQGDVYEELYSGLNISSPIIAVDASNVVVENCSFNYITNEDRPDPAIVVYGKRKGCDNIIIRSNKFLVSGVAFFCDVSNSVVTGNLFDQSIRALRVETMYDERPYRNPKGILINNNTIKGQDRILPRPQGWISGIHRVSFIDNYIESSSDGLFLYCGDGNIALDSVAVCRNQFVMRKDSTTFKQPRYCILVRGKSYPFQKKGLTLGNNVIISDNTFTSKDICKDSQIQYNKAIEINFVNNIKIIDNTVKDFSSFVGLTDDFRGLQERCSTVIINGNHIYATFNNPVRVTTDIKSCEISNNMFYNCNVENNYRINLQKLSNLKLEGNVINVPIIHSEKIIYVKHAFHVRGKNNKVKEGYSY